MINPNNIHVYPLVNQEFAIEHGITWPFVVALYFQMVFQFANCDRLPEVLLTLW